MSSVKTPITLFYLGRNHTYRGKQVLEHVYVQTLEDFMEVLASEGHDGDFYAIPRERYVRLETSRTGRGKRGRDALGYAYTGSTYTDDEGTEWFSGPWVPKKIDGIEPEDLERLRLRDWATAKSYDDWREHEKARKMPFGASESVSNLARIYSELSRGGARQRFMTELVRQILTGVK